MLADRILLSFPATPEEFERALGEARKSFEDAGLPRQARYNAEVVFEEVVTNIVRHGRAGLAGANVEFSMEVGADAAVLVFIDNGVAFNPCTAPEPDFFSSLTNASLGGLGISLVRKASTSMTYERTPQQRNRLTVSVATRRQPPIRL